MDADVIVVGGAVIGSSIACHLIKAEPSMSVLVIERDPSYEFSSTVRSDGNVRIQFGLEENVRISMYMLEVLETFADEYAVGGFRPEPDARHQGNLFLTDAANEESARAGVRVQRSLGCDVDWLPAAEIAERWPVLASSRLTGGTFSQIDGGVDSNAVMQGYRRTAMARGVRYHQGEVRSLAAEAGIIRGVELVDGTSLTAPVVVNAAGAWARELCATVHVDLPVLPVMRTVHRVEADLDGATGLPSFFLPNGVYALPESAASFLVGWSRPEDPVGFDFRYSRASFEPLIWPELVEALPAFDRLRVAGGWTGLYAVNTLDGNAILGEWPELSGLYLANGFSGHGFQQCAAVGRYLAELITDRPVTLDLARLGPQRILDGRPLPDAADRII